MALNQEAYKNADASGDGFKDLKKGIYVCRIIDPLDVEDKQMLKIKYDINEGEFKGYFTDKEKAFGQYPNDGFHYRSYKETAMAFFKGFITAIEKSNTGYNFEKAKYDFKTLTGKLFVGVFGEEEIPFADDHGNPMVKVRLQKVRSMASFNAGELKVPTEIEKLKGDQLELFKNQTYTDKVVAERKAAVTTTAQQLETAKTNTVVDNEAFYETSKKLASEEDLPF